MLFYFIFIPIITILDLSTKYLAIHYLQGKEIELIKGLLYFKKDLNDGGALGILSGQTMLFIIATIVIILLIIFYVIKEKPKNNIYNIAFSFIIGGGIGNLIDRIRWQEVVDFIKIPNLFTFNIADAFIVIGAILLCICVLFSKDKHS